MLLRRVLHQTMYLAFSRDRLLPFSGVWTQVNGWTGIPLYAVWISIFCCIAINLIALGSYTASLGVFNVCAIALDWSYCVPIFCKIMSKKFKPGPWHMGKLGLFVNIWACLWTFFVTIIFVMPTARPVTPVTMNYAIAFLGLILGFALVYWWAGGRKFYKGPLIEAEFIEGEAPNSDAKSGSDKPAEEPEEV